MGIKHSTLKSFEFAFAGIATALQKEPNFKIHLSFGVLALIFAAILGFSAIEWLILAFTITFVLVLELVNTALEVIVNLLSPEVRQEARVAKDVSAASVLLASILAIGVGTALFLPKILLLLR